MIIEILLMILWFVAFALGAGLFGAEIVSAKLDNVVNQLEKQGFSREEIIKVFADVRLKIYADIPHFKAKRVDYFSKAYALFSPSSIIRGRNFLETYKKILERAEKEFRVRKEVIVAILRLETNFGNFVGTRPLINTFYSMLMLDFRKDFAEKELVNLFLMARQNQKDIFSFCGSFMGAFGLCQFLPSSCLRYGVDADGDGIVNLNSVDDAVFSAARYLRAHGWSNSDFYRQYEAIYAYNHDSMYVLAVLAYASFLKDFSDLASYSKSRRF